MLMPSPCATTDPPSRDGYGSTPGCSSVRSVKLRPLSGSDSIACWPTRKLSSEVAVFTSGMSPLTVIACSTPTSMTSGSDTISPTVATRSRRSARNPDRSAASS